MQAEAAWSLGILGRSAASAVPLLISTFEAAPESSDVVREVIAEALAEISRGTPDEDRVLASLAKAWKTAPKTQKTVFARGSEVSARSQNSLSRISNNGLPTESVQRFDAFDIRDPDVEYLCVNSVTHASLR